MAKISLMKGKYFFIFLMFFFLQSRGQEDSENITNSMAMSSRLKADIVFCHFDAIHAPRLLYTVMDKDFGLIIRDFPTYKEYTFTWTA